MKKFKGVISPIITPFNKDGSFYEKGLDNILTFLKNNGVEGIFAIGSYGSFPLMEIEERKKISKYVIEKSKFIGLKSIIHIGHASTDYTIELANYADQFSPDAIAMVIPYYYSGHAYDEKNILSHFKAVSEKTNSPLHFYNNPRTTKVSASPEMLKELVKMGLSGLKDSGSDMEQFKRYADIVWSMNEDFDLMPGSGSVFVAGFELGAQACVAGTSMAFPHLVTKMYEEIISNDYDAAKITQILVNKARDLQNKFNMRPASAYDILDLQGIDCGVPRRPWRLLNKNEKTDIRDELKKINAI